MLSTGNSDAFFQQCQSIKLAFPVAMTIVKRLHLLSSNTISRVERSQQTDKVFHVLADDISMLGLELTTCIDEARQKLQDLTVLVTGEEPINFALKGRVITCLRQLNLILSLVSTIVKKGEYLAVYSSLEAIHVSDDSVTFDAVGPQLKVLMMQLKEYYQQHLVLLDDMIRRVQSGQTLD